MSRWFRWYEGTTEDGKFRVVARKSRVTVRDVIALWAFMLEDAAHLEHRGVCQRNEDFMASILDFDDGVVETILATMEDVGMISVGLGAITICNFSKRQFDGDLDPTAADRQRRKRERDKQVSNADVTRDSRPPETDTDTEKKIVPDGTICPEPEKSAPAVVSPTAAELPCVSGEQYPVTEADIAEWRSAFPAVDIRQQLGAMRSWLIANPTRRKTRKGMRRFVVSWLDRKQNSGHSPPPDQRSSGPPRHQTAVEANISRRIKRNEPAGGRFDSPDAELLPPDKPELRALVRNAGQALSWPD